MTRRSLGARVEALEVARRKWEAEHLPRAEVLAFLYDILTVVQEEAGQATFQRVAGRIVGQKAARVASLQGGRR